MGSNAHVVVVGGNGNTLVRAKRRIEALESKWSRFRATSDITLINDSRGDWCDISLETAVLLQRALDANRLTNGRFDCLVHNDLVRLGYDADFDSVVSKRELYSSVDGHERGPCSSAATTQILSGKGGLELDAQSNRARVVDGERIDLGGIGKGQGAQLVAEELMRDEAGVRGVMVSLGGDVYVIGEPQHGEIWAIDVADPFDGARNLATVVMHEGAIATSSCLRHRWVQAGATQHHLIDPLTHMCTTSEYVAVTVVTSEGWWAEALTKTLMVDGSNVNADGFAAIAVRNDGTVTTLGPTEGYFRDVKNIAIGSV